MPAKNGISNKRKYKPCPQCGELFFGPTRYCSNECVSKAGKPIPKRNGVYKQCEECDKEFYAPKHRINKARFCSLDCLNQWQGRNKIEATCETCGNTFWVSASRIIHDPTKYCSIECRDTNPDFLNMLTDLNIKQQTLSPNKLEITGYAILDSLQIEYVKQYSIANKFVVDAFIPSIKLIIQFDGDYWHGNPEKFSELDKRQQKRVNIDRSQNAYFKKHGFKVLRFWESDVYTTPDIVKKRIKQAL